jgi:hypothetical protein
MTKSKFWTAALCLGVSTFLGGQRLWAAEPDKALWDELKVTMEAEGWAPIAQGVFERQRGTRVEHLAYGREGLAWTVGELNRRLKRLTREYESYPSDELGDTIDNLKIKIASLRQEMRSLPEEGIASFTEAVTGGSCSNICYSATAYAYPLTSSQGTGAIADAKFNSACGYVGNAYAYAYARATTAGGTQTVKIIEDPVAGTRAASAAATGHAEATAPGSTDCYSEAYASTDSTALGIAYSTSSANSSCPIPQPTGVTIGGPTSTTINGTACQTVTWTTSVTGGAAPYTYAWTLNGAAAGSGSSLSRQYCGNNTNSTSTQNVGVTVNGVVSDTHTTTIAYTYTPPSCTTTIGGPTSVDLYGVECQTLTWTSTVSCGSSVTYAWTIGGVAAGTSTSTSVSKTYCGNNRDRTQTVNLSLAVTGSFGNATDTHATTINFSGNGCDASGFCP